MSQIVDENVSRERSPEPREAQDDLDPAEALAIFLVGGEHGLGESSLRLFAATHSKDYRQVLFVAVGVMDYAIIDAGVDPGQGFKGTEVARSLEEKTRRDLDPYLAAAHRWGMKAACRVSIATDPVDEFSRLAGGISRDYPRAVFFVSQLEFRKRRWFHRLLHGDESSVLRRKIGDQGLPFVVLHVIVP